jgi:uncharacterized SAM-binding protein YcdF (DUF218 family)
MRVLRVLTVAFVVFAAMLVIIWALWRDQPTSNTTQKKFDIILVLGTPALKDGTPSPVQRSRVLEGVRQWRTGIAPRLVMSGGPAHNQWVEADTMAKLAESQGVPAANVFEERQAHDTIQNIYYTVQIMQTHGWKSAEVVSSWSHLPRAAMILQHFPIAWRTQPAPWPPHYGFLERTLIDWNEAQYCFTLRLHGFRPSRFISRRS